MEVGDQDVEDYHDIVNALMDGPSVPATCSFRIDWSGEHSVQQIRDVTVGNAEGGARPPMPMAMMRAAGVAAPPPVAEPGDAEVSVTIQAEVWLAPKGQ